MNDDLLTTARTLAERGWLPGIDNRFVNSLLWCTTTGLYATEADLHLAAHREIVRRGWAYRIGEYTVIADNTRKAFGHASHRNRGNDTTALLRCLLAACEASEGEGKR